MKKIIISILAVVVGIGVFWFIWEGIGMSVIPSVIIGGAAAFVVWFICNKLTKKGSGFLSAKETCAICGKEVGLNRFLMGKTLDGKSIWKCPECAKKGGFVEIDYATGKATLKTEQETEVRVKCNVCGHLYCYTAADIERNRQNANRAKMKAVSAMANAVGGTTIGARLDNDSAQNSLDKIVDYSRCPKCNSTDVRVLNKEEYEKEQKAISAGKPSVSSADELKKFKELLDSGVITQEEFDAKKKQLLGL